MKFAEMLMDLETVIQSIESQQEKNKYGLNIISVICGIKKAIERTLFAKQK